MQYKTSQLESEIKQLYKQAKIEYKYNVDVDDIILFKECSDSSAPGIYVFADQNGYYLKEVGDRGRVVEAKSTNSLDEICYWACHVLIISVALKYAMINKEEGRDWRRVLFQKELELLYRIKPEYFKRGKREIDSILNDSPFDDALLS